MNYRPIPERIEEIRDDNATRGPEGVAIDDLLAEIDALKAELEEAQEDAIADPMMLIEELREDLRDVAKQRDALKAESRTVWVVSEFLGYETEHYTAHRTKAGADAELARRVAEKPDGEYSVAEWSVEP